MVGRQHRHSRARACNFIEQPEQRRLPASRTTKPKKPSPASAADGTARRPLKPGEKNGIKFETFVFDAMAQAEHAFTLETQRGEDFSPVKNASGDDSPETTRRDLQHQYARWLEAAGIKVPRKADGTLDCTLELSPSPSLDGENLSNKGLVIHPGGVLAI